MPLYVVQIFKQHPLEIRPWSNRYIIQATLLPEAASVATEIVTAEQAFHNQSTQFTYARVSTILPNDGFYVTVPINDNGNRVDPADNLPLWNTLRVDVSVVGGGRPSRKFYRLPLGESDVNNYVVQPTIISLVDTTLTALVASLQGGGTPLVDPDGQEWDAITVSNRVQMRQLHRKRRRTPAA